VVVLVKKRVVASGTLNKEMVLGELENSPLHKGAALICTS
jgi:hypothetical protein